MLVTTNSSVASRVTRTSLRGPSPARRKCACQPACVRMAVDDLRVWLVGRTEACVVAG